MSNQQHLTIHDYIKHLGITDMSDQYRVLTAIGWHPYSWQDLSLTWRDLVIACSTVKGVSP